MASESSSAPKRSPATKAPLSPPTMSSSSVASGLPGLAGGNWRPVPVARASSLASIQSEQAVATPRRPSIPHSSASTPPTLASTRPGPSSPSPSPAVRPADPTVAAGPVYTPSRLVSRSSSSAQRLPKTSFGGSDQPWQNFDRITTTPAPVVPSPSSSFDPFAPPPRSSFASIQSEQIAQVAAVKDHKAPRSFAEVMAAEQAEARRREEEDREAREFAKWFEEESKRVQAEEAAVRAAVTGGSGGGKKGSKGGKGGGGGGGASSGRPKGGRKSVPASDSAQAIEASGSSTPQKGKKPAKGSGGGASRNTPRAEGAGAGKGKGKIGGADATPFSPSLPV